jgi:hypothetical protein
MTDYDIIICKWHWQEADRTIIVGWWLFEQGLVMQFGGPLLTFFFVTRPVPPLTRQAAILDVLARIAHLESSTALAAFGTTRHRSFHEVFHGTI